MVCGEEVALCCTVMATRHAIERCNAIQRHNRFILDLWFVVNDGVSGGSWASGSHADPQRLACGPTVVFSVTVPPWSGTDAASSFYGSIMRSGPRAACSQVTNKQYYGEADTKADALVRVHACMHGHKIIWQSESVLWS